MTKKEKRWVKRFKTWIAAKPSRPGVWRMRRGGYVIRGRAKDPRTGKVREVKRKLEGSEVTALTAYNE
ncbi:MAG: hypothetical protein ACK2UA_07470, partial [Anaerolineae bacterium]